MLTGALVGSVGCDGQREVDGEAGDLGGEKGPVQAGVKGTAGQELTASNQVALRLELPGEGAPTLSLLAFHAATRFDDANLPGASAQWQKRQVSPLELVDPLVIAPPTQPGCETVRSVAPLKGFGRRGACRIGRPRRRRRRGEWQTGGRSRGPGRNRRGLFNLGRSSQR